MDKNCLSYWYPKIIGIVPTPYTIIYKTDVPLLQLLDGKIPSGFNEFIEDFGKATDHFGYPCFLRTGHTSGKFHWKFTCCLSSREALPAHIAALVEYSELVSILGLPYNVWVVREFLPIKPFGTAFEGMPVCKEFRVFVEDDEVKCWHSYWPVDSFKQGIPEWYNDLCELEEDDKQIVLKNAAKAGKAVGGAWSVDLLKTTNGWYVTDMAVAEDSWHWPTCPNATKKKDQI